jgi:hypothetical protein
VSENRLLRRITGHKRWELTGGGRKIQNEKLHNAHNLPILLIIK